MTIVRRIIEILALLVVGFLLGISNVSEYTFDIVRWIRLNVALHGVSAAPGASLYFMIGGLLVGPGLFVLLRDRLVKEWPMMRIRSAEHTSSYDAFVRIASRFGVSRYLDRCAKWGWHQKDVDNGGALVLFRIVGVGPLNDARGTAVGTRLLRKIAWQMRSYAVPQTASRVHDWVGQYTPWLLHWDSNHPVFGLAGRWSGSTFALAFREIEVQDVVRLALKVANMLREELRKADSNSSLGLRVGFAVAPVRAAPIAMEDAAEAALKAADDSHIVMCYTASDTRASLVEAGEIVPKEVDIGLLKPEQAAAAAPRTWLSLVPGVALTVAGLAIVSLGASKTEFTPDYPWPATMKTIPLLEEKGSHEVETMQTTLEDQEQGHWRIANAQVLQSKDYEPRLGIVFVHVSVTNLDSSRRFVSFFNFKILDAGHRESEFVPYRTLRMAQSFSGKWLGQNETLEGWMVGRREQDPIVGLVFSRETQITLRAAK